MNRRRFRLAASLMVCGLVAQSFTGGCSRPRDPFDVRSLPDAPFSVNTALLGPVQVDSLLGLQFRLPAEFQPGNPERVEQIREMVRAGAKLGDPLAHDPVWIFGVPGSVGMFKVAHFREPPAGGMNEAWIDRVRSEMEAQVKPATVVEDRFRVGGRIPVVRFVVGNESMVLVRAICQVPGHPPGMIDCLLPRPDHERLGPAVESAIGALAPR